MIFPQVQLYIFGMSNYDMDPYLQKNETTFEQNYKNLIKEKSE